jgi:hypothetical protein
MGGTTDNKIYDRICKQSQIEQDGFIIKKSVTMHDHMNVKKKHYLQ